MSELIEILKSLHDRLSALVYCQRYCTQDICEQLKVLETDLDIKVINIVKDFISSEIQKDTELLKNFKALHQSPELELKKSISCSVKRTIFLRLPKKDVLRGPVGVLVTPLRKQLPLPSLSKPPIYSSSL